MFYREKDKLEIQEWIKAAFTTAEEKFGAQILVLQQEIADLKAVNLELMREVADLKFRAENAATTSESSPESIFYLEEQADVYFPNDRAKVPAKILQAADIADLKNFLSASDDETGKKFLRLLDNHANLANNFNVRLNLDELSDNELSEAVTARYFKIFQQVIFDNILLAINRGLDENPVFYFEFLRRVNDYLSRCGIYTVNAKSGVTVSDEDYQNMTPQIRKTVDGDQNGLILEIERLPYRINYLTEFGELKFLQYNGIMTIGKAV